MRKRLSVASVPVSDQARARDFYVEVMGFSLLRESPIERGRHWVQLALPGDDTSITLVTWFETMLAGSLRGTVSRPTISRLSCRADRQGRLAVGDFHSALGALFHCCRPRWQQDPC